MSPTPGLRDTYGYALLLDGHTGSPRRMKDQEVIIGTRHDATCAPKLAAVVSAIFTRHDFNVHENVAGYTGGDIVATFGQPRTQRVHALQLEIDAALLMTTSRDEFIRAYHAASRDDALLKELYPVLEEIVRLHRAGTR
jgi:N-formylglutamate amidohydrolase